MSPVTCNLGVLTCVTFLFFSLFFFSLVFPIQYGLSQSDRQKAREHFFFLASVVETMCNSSLMEHVYCYYQLWYKTNQFTNNENMPISFFEMLNSGQRLFYWGMHGVNSFKIFGYWERRSFPIQLDLVRMCRTIWDAVFPS